MMQADDMLELKSRISVQCYVVEATLLVGSKTPYLLPVLAHMKDSDWATADSLAEELFLSRAVGSMLLEKCSRRGLSTEIREGMHRITDEGIESLNEKKVYDTRHGVWVIHYTDCPLIPTERRILYVSDGDEVEGYVKTTPGWMSGGHGGRSRGESGTWDSNEDQPEAEKLPGHILDLEGTHMSAMMEHGACEFIPDKIMPYGKKFPSKMSAILTWSVGTGKSSLSISTSGAEPEGSRHQISGGQLFDGPDVSYREIWDGLLASLRVADSDESWI